MRLLIWLHCGNYLVYVGQNNRYSMGTTVKDLLPWLNYAKGESFSMLGIQVNGMDI